MNLTAEDMESFHRGDQIQKKRHNIIEAATAVAEMLTEEQWNELMALGERSKVFDTKTSYRLMGKLIDLAQAVQDAQS